MSDLLGHRAANSPIEDDDGLTSRIFDELARLASLAASRGDYGISAAAVAWLGDRRIISYGSNHLFSDRDPVAHAEVRALAGLRRYLLDGTSREAPTGADYVMSDAVQSPGPGLLALYSSLEPCPMCTVALLNAGVHVVVIGAKDPIAGGLPDAATSLGEVWRDIARQRGLRVVQAHPEAANMWRIREATLASLREAFDTSRSSLDRALVTGVLGQPPQA